MSVSGGTGVLGAKAFMATIGFLAGIAAVSFALLWMDGADGDFPWGFALVMWMFVTGLSQAGICFTAVMRLCKAEFSGVFYRLGEVMTLAFLPFAFIGFALIFSCGRESLFYWLQEERPRAPGFVAERESAAVAQPRGAGGLLRAFPCCISSGACCRMSATNWLKAAIPCAAPAGGGWRPGAGG